MTINYDMTAAEYRAAFGVNITSLKKIARSPQHYIAGLRQGNEPTTAQRIGTLVHSEVLEPLIESYVVKPTGMSFTSKEGKEWKAAQIRPIIDEEDAGHIRSMAASISSHRAAHDLVSTTKHEVSVFGEHKPTGIRIKGRIDMLDATRFPDVGPIVADLKTCEDASPSEFAWAAKRYGYVAQAAFYADLVGASRFFFVAVEKTPPYAVGVYELDERTLAAGRAQYEQWLTTLRKCMDQNKWPAYGQDIVTFTIL